MNAYNVKTMKSHTEIEERALLSQEQHEAVYEHLKTLGNVKTSRRVMINYNALDYERQKTVELRLNDGLLTKVTKTGVFGGTMQEETIQIDTPLQAALQDMADQGYTHAKVSLRIRHVVIHSDYEYCLRDVLRYDDPSTHSYPPLFEIEAQAGTLQNETAIRQEIHAILTSLGINAVSTDEFKLWSEYNHTKVDGNFIYSPQKAVQLAGMLRSYDFYKLPQGVR